MKLIDKDALVMIGLAVGYVIGYFIQKREEV